MSDIGLSPKDVLDLDDGDLGQPVRLAELVDRRSRRLVEGSARPLGVGVHLVASDGEALVGGPVPPEALAAAGPILSACRVCDCDVPDEAPVVWLVRQVLHEGEPIGTLVVGGFPPEREAALLAPGQHIADLVDHIVDTGLEKLLASRMHVATMEHAYEELQQKNMRLAAAVERLQELDKVKSNFLATVSHELRTPLTSVIGYSEMLYEGLAGPLNDEQREYVRTVMEKGEQLLGIITGILDISRIEAGAVTLTCTEFAIREIIDGAVSTLTPTMRRKKLALDMHVPEALPMVLADRDKVRQVLVNLLGNAVKFTPEGGEVKVLVETAPLRRSSPLAESGVPMRDDLRPAIRVAVQDSGIGIPREAIGRIFEPFYQVDSSSTRQYGGTGLGLAIVKSFVHAHGGSVWVESCPGKGSKFFVTLPAAG